MYASPGQRVQWLPAAHVEHTRTSVMTMERTSDNCGEQRHMSRKGAWRTFPDGRGNCTQGNTSPYGDT